jgi:hypothetical protein
MNQRFALKDTADAHKAVEARATTGSTRSDHLTQIQRNFP